MSANGALNSILSVRFTPSVTLSCFSKDKDIAVYFYANCINMTISMPCLYSLHAIDLGML